MHWAEWLNAKLNSVATEFDQNSTQADSRTYYIIGPYTDTDIDNGHRLRLKLRLILDGRHRNTQTKAGMLQQAAGRQTEKKTSGSLSAHFPTFSLQELR